MKKILAILLTIAMLLPATAWACEYPSAILAKAEASATVYTDVSYWAMTYDHKISGIKDCGEALPAFPVQRVCGMYVSGCVENGLVREPAMIRLIPSGETVIGLTALCNVTVMIDMEYREIVQEIVTRRIGENTELSANSVIACTTWRIGDYVTHIFFPSYSERFVIGSVTFNAGQDVTMLYAADFDGDGSLELGFAAGWRIPEPEPETQEQTNNNVIVETGASASANATSSASASTMVNMQNSGTIDNSGDGCYRNNTIIQVNLFSIVKNCVRFIKECVK